MLTLIDKSNVYTKLRDKAEAQLLSGSTPTASQGTMGVDALRLLHRLSSEPDKAQDALKLLHELQVHQVEIDLQNEQIAANELAIIEDLSLYQTLYEAAPLGYFLVDLEGKIIQGNLAAAELLGVGRKDFAGHPIDAFLRAENRPQLLGLLQRVVQSGGRGSCLAETGRGVAQSRQLQFLASLSPGGEHILLACCEGASADSGNHSS